LAIGLLPAWQAASVNVQEALKEAGRGSVGSGGRLRSGLLVAEVSLSLVLLIAVGLLLASFARLQRVKPGFEPGGVFTAQLALPPTRYDRQKLVAFYEPLLQRLSTLPGSPSTALPDRGPAHGGPSPTARAAGRRLPPPGTAAAGRLHEHPRADERQSRGDAARRARGAANGGPGSPAAATAAALGARRADGRRSQTRADAAGGIRGPGARARGPRRVQRDGASRDLPHERDRPSHGAWRIPGRGDANGAESRPAADAR